MKRGQAPKANPIQGVTWNADELSSSSSAACVVRYGDERMKQKEFLFECIPHPGRRWAFGKRSHSKLHLSLSLRHLPRHLQSRTCLTGNARFNQSRPEGGRKSRELTRIAEASLTAGCVLPVPWKIHLHEDRLLPRALKRPLTAHACSP